MQKFLELKQISGLPVFISAEQLTKISRIEECKGFDRIPNYTLIFFFSGVDAERIGTVSVQGAPSEVMQLIKDFLANA